MVGNYDVEPVIGRFNDDGTGLAGASGDRQASKIGIPIAAIHHIGLPNRYRFDKCHADPHRFRIPGGENAHNKQACERETGTKFSMRTKPLR